MSFVVQDRSRVGQSTYWMYFGGFFVAAIVLIGIAIEELLRFNFGTALICFLLTAPLGIYFRVIMMRRCRDIGWPAFLPWTFMALSFVLGFSSGLSGLGRPMGSPPSMAVLSLPVLLGMADFIFSIVIGCIGSKQYDLPYGDIFGPDGYAPVPARPLPAGGGLPREFGSGPAPALARDGAPAAAAEQIDYDRFDAAIAQALAAKSGGSPAAAQPSYDRPVVTPRAGGFGRKGL